MDAVNLCGIWLNFPGVTVHAHAPDAAGYWTRKVLQQMLAQRRSVLDGRRRQFEMAHRAMDLITIENFMRAAEYEERTIEKQKLRQFQSYAVLMSEL